MARINITENILRPNAPALGTDIPFIIGYTSKSDAKFTQPILCESVTKFEIEFGAEPAAVGNGSDTSYIMAKELLKAGMPIYYYALKSGASVSIRSINILRGVMAGEVEVAASGLTITGKDLNDNGATLTPVFTKTSSGTGTVTVKASDDRITAAYDSDNDAITLSLTSGKTVEDDDTITFNLYAYESADTSISATLATNDVKAALKEIEDKGEYSIKYITCGGYVTPSEVYQDMLTTAETRGDAIALIELGQETGNPNFAELYSTFKTDIADTINRSYGAVFTHAAEYTLEASYGDLDIKTAVLPGCYGYLRALASAIKSSPNWFAIAGVSRGVVPNLKKLNCSSRLSNTIAESFQPMHATQAGTADIAINAITDIKPYGFTIWGNRTLADISNAEGEDLNPECFLNIRNMLCDIKKLAYRVAKELMYEQNTELVWLKFKSRVTPFLDQLKSGNGIYDYKLIKFKELNGKDLLKHEFACGIKVQPIRAIEAIDINVIVTDTDVNVD